MGKEKLFDQLLDKSNEVEPNEIDSSVEIKNKLLDLLHNSEQTYMDNVENIIGSSIEQLKMQNKFKRTIRLYFILFFSIFLSVEFIGLLIILFGNNYFCISETIIIAYITSIFVETISVILLMVKFTFDSQQEIQSLQILNNAIEKIQKL